MKSLQLDLSYQLSPIRLKTLLNLFMRHGHLHDHLIFTKNHVDQSLMPLFKIHQAAATVPNRFCGNYTYSHSTWVPLDWFSPLFSTFLRSYQPIPHSTNPHAAATAATSRKPGQRWPHRQPGLQRDRQAARWHEIR